MEFEYTITNISRHINGYQSVTLYEVKNEYFTLHITRYGNQGFDAPKTTRLYSGSTYFHAVNTFLRAFYSEKLERYFLLKEGSVSRFKLERYF